MKSVLLILCGVLMQTQLLAAPFLGATSTIEEAARGQIGVTLLYDPAYVGLSYPGGDVPSDRGVCTDVVIRALREAKNFDLQKAVHEDMAGNFAAYPQQWGLKAPDKNIDHRRVPNLETFFKRKGWSRPVTKNADDYLPGDFVTVRLPLGQPHIMVVSTKKSTSGTPLVIHNIGAGTREDNCLFGFRLIGHYRVR